MDVLHADQVEVRIGHVEAEVQRGILEPLAVWMKPMSTILSTS